MARRDVYIGPSRTVAPSTKQNKNRFFYFIFLLEKEILCRYFACLRRAARGGQKSRNAHKKNNNIRPVVCPPKRNKQMEKTKHTETLVVFDPPVEMIALRAISPNNDTTILTSMLGSKANSSSSLFWALHSAEPLVLVVRRVRRPSKGWIQISRRSSRRSTRAASEVEAEAASFLRLLASLASRRLRSCCSYCKKDKI